MIIHYSTVYYLHFCITSLCLLVADTVQAEVQQAPPPKMIDCLYFWYLFCIRMLLNKAQVAWKSI